MGRRRSQLGAVGSLCSALLLVVACGGGLGGGLGGSGGGGSDDGGSNGGGGSSEELSSCDLGQVDIEQIDASQTEDVYTSLPNSYAVASMQTTGAGQDAARIEFGFTNRETIDGFRNGTFLQGEINVVVDGSSGSIESKPGRKLGLQSVAVNREGEYIGKNGGFWLTRFSKANGDWSGSWNIDSYEVGGRITGTATITMEPICAASLNSSITYEISYDLPLKEENGDAANRCFLLAAGQVVPGDISLGQLDVEVDGDSWDDDPGVAVYNGARNAINLGREGENRRLQVAVENPEFGENQPQSGLVYKDGTCEYQVMDPASNTVTIEDNGNGAVPFGPTEGSFDLQLQRTQGSSSECAGAPLDITGSFGLAACKRTSF